MVLDGSGVVIGGYGKEKMLQNCYIRECIRYLGIFEGYYVGKCWEWY